MLKNKPQLVLSEVFHKRLFPRENSLKYKVYYTLFDVQELDRLPIKTNKFAPVAFHEKDHGAKDGSSNYEWAKEVLKQHGIGFSGNILLLSMPRIMGYTFNPVSFWFCINNNKLEAVIAEVNNTFGESHSYICYNSKTRQIDQEDWLEANKVFHVSPFLEREGKYKFRFALQEEKLFIAIDFYDADNNRKLITTLSGKIEEMTKSSVRKLFWRFPFVTLKVIALIHYQALKLFFKGIKYKVKPKQLEPKVTTTHDNK